MNKIEQIEKDIKDLNIQGATNVAIATLEGIRDFVKVSTESDPQKLLEEFLRVGDQLACARPNEPLARNGVKYVRHFVKDSISDLQSRESMKQTLERLSEDYLNLISSAKRNIVSKCVPYAKNYGNILTHCHSSTAVSVIKGIAEDKPYFGAVCTETRPLYQGRKTAKSLLEAGISTTMISDSAAESFVIGRGSLSIDAVLMGADQITTKGHCINKIGSWGISMAAHYADKPLYIVSPLLKVDTSTVGFDIKIEIREDREIWEDAPSGLDLFNPAFEIVDSTLISGFMTEFGIVPPDKVGLVTRANYPWLFES